MDTIRFLAIDLAKNVFQVHGVDAAGKLVLRRRVGRAQLAELVLRLAPCTIGMEAVRQSVDVMSLQGNSAS